MNRFREFERNLDNHRAATSKDHLELLQMQRAQVWFLEAVKQSGFELFERTITMLEGALHHQTEPESEVFSPVRKPVDLPIIGEHLESENNNTENSSPVKNVVVSQMPHMSMFSN
jgi:hypothetical protein